MVFDSYGLGEATGGDRELIEEANVAEEDKTHSCASSG